MRVVRTASMLMALALLSVLPALGADAPPETPPPAQEPPTTPVPPAAPPVENPPPAPAAAPSQSVRAPEEAPLPGRSKGEVEGVVTVRGKGVPGAVAAMLHLTSGRTFRSEPATTAGHYKILHLPYGYYSVTIEHDGMVYPGDRPLDLSPGKRQRLDLSLTNTAPESMAGTGAPEAAGAPSGASGASSSTPGLRAGGLAELQGLDRTPFLKTPIGLITLVGGIVVFLLLV